ncbi:MAG TPA: CapA family protein [Bacteroidales bacterium]|nr:CapA family protein [Bacteroidales bacterium]
MSGVFLTIAFLLSLTFQIVGQDTINTRDRITLVFIGDIMGHDDQIKSAEISETDSFNYDDVFSYIKPEISGADIAIGNLEVTLAGPPYTGYPLFSSPVELAVACKNAGIDCLVTANNHTADRGKTGIARTINRLDSIGMMHTGSFRDQEERDSLYPLIIRKEDVSLALLNYTYGTNRIKVPEPTIVNILDKDLIADDIRKALANNPDIIIVFLHWGTEYDTIPSKSQTDMAEYLFSLGVDMIIGSHPHVIQKMIWTKNDTLRKDKFLVYSLGNFVSNQSKPGRDGGLMVRVELTRKSDSFEVTNAGYYITWVYTPVIDNRKRFYILPCSKFENKPELFSNPSDYIRMKSFIDNSRSLLSNQNINVKEYIYNDNEWVIF